MIWEFVKNLNLELNMKSIQIPSPGLVRFNSRKISKKNLVGRSLQYAHQLFVLKMYILKDSLVPHKVIQPLDLLISTVLGKYSIKTG